ncbi:hypothetical protein LUD75_13320 [Epilithonimonas sp. JDS]|uniref:hypothetical protein n=1 Tax=Chryseobacterium group TaxID=2782232 RepID=UPI0004E34256|nr:MULTISPECIES: hypothetical protein [Chryseobacterium group]KFC20571.1 hypothetical protein IO90_15640 [Chryseobacterium sp. FH1]MCD9855697.1 hypothetical protein [Epilithonimonas sp. JDS]WDF45513.1 hypothetical protein PQ459_11460 [Chryseobacterium sp. KACC 21268]
MKNYTLIAVVSLITLTLIQLAYMFQRYGFSENVYLVTNILQILAYAGLTSFFIKLYQKQK